MANKTQENCYSLRNHQLQAKHMQKKNAKNIETQKTETILKAAYISSYCIAIKTGLYLHSQEKRTISQYN